jgi:hypothetical protein
MDGTNVVNTSPDSSTKELASPSFLRVLFGVLAVVGILSGPVWIFFDPGNLELGEFGYLGLTFVIIPILSFFWLFALHFFKQWSADNRRTSKFLVIGVIFLFAGLLIASHDSVRGLAFRPDIVFGPLRYWHEYVLVVMAAGWILGFGWLILKRKNLLQAVCGHMLFILVLGIFLPSVLAGYAQAKVANASLWKKSAVTEDACSAIISRDRYDCSQALGVGKQDLSYCSDSRPDLSCVRPFALKGDYSFCKGDLLSRGNPKGWIPGEVEVVAGGVSKYEAKFGLDDSQMVQLYCIAGLLHQKWRADCDWLPEEMASVCRNQEVGEVCKFLDGKSGLACTTALDGEDLFTRNWFDRNFHIWSKQINFYTDGKSFEQLGYLKMPLDLHNRTQVFDQDSLQKDILIKRILYLKEITEI